MAFLSEETRPQLQEIDKVVKTKLEQARDCMHAAREKYGYSTLFKSAKRKRQKGKSLLASHVHHRLMTLSQSLIQSQSVRMTVKKR